MSANSDQQAGAAGSAQLAGQDGTVLDQEAFFQALLSDNLRDWAFQTAAAAAIAAPPSAPSQAPAPASALQRCVHAGNREPGGYL